MRTEIKIALGLYALGTLLRYLLQTSEYVNGFLYGMSLFFMIIGLLPDRVYLKFKTYQKNKHLIFRKIKNPTS